MKNFINTKKKQHIFYLIVFTLICLFSTWINQIPEGYIIAQGDHPASINIKSSFSRCLYLWTYTCIGAGYLGGFDPPYIIHHSLYYLLDLFGFSDTQKMNVKYFLFLFLSGFFMYLALEIFFKSKISPLIQFIIAFFYTFNTIIFLSVVTTGAYLGYHDLYSFFPLIWVLFIRGLIDRKNQYLVFSIILFFLSLAGFKNPAFLVLVLIILGMSVLYCWLTRLISFKQVLFSLVIFIAFLFSIAFYTLSLYILFLDVSRGALPVIVSTYQAVREWIINNSTPVIYLFRFHSFTSVLPYGNITKKIIDILAFYPSFFIAITLLLLNNIKDRKDKKWLFFFTITFLIILFGSAKVTLFKGLSIFIFTLPIINSLKSWDKFIMLQPFFAAMVIVFLLEIVDKKSKKIRISVFALIILLISITSLPFFIGKFHQNVSMSYLWSNQYNTMVKTPRYYKDLADKVNLDKSYFKILYMPYSEHIGLGWTSYPKWKFHGGDHTTFYFNNPVYLPIEGDYNFSYSKSIFLNPNVDWNPFINMLRIRGIKYLVLNKDVGGKYIVAFKKFFRGTETNFIFIESFGNLELYKILNEKELPVIYITTSKGAVFSNQNSNDTSTSLPIYYTKYFDYTPLTLSSDVRNMDIFFFLVDSRWEDLTIDLCRQASITGETTEVKIEKADVYEIFLDAENISQDELPFFEIWVDNNEAMQSEIPQKFYSKYIKIAQFEIEKPGKHIIKIKNQIAKIKNKEDYLKLILVNQEKRKSLEKEIWKKINHPKTELCYIFEEQKRELFYVP